MKLLLMRKALRKHTIMAGVPTSSQPYNECFKVRDTQHWSLRCDPMDFPWEPHQTWLHQIAYFAPWRNHLSGESVQIPFVQVQIHDAGN